MDSTLILLIISAVIVLVVMILLNKFNSSKNKKEKEEKDDETVNNQNTNNRVNNARNRAANRERLRNRLRNARNQNNAEEGDDSEVEDELQDVRNFAMNLAGTAQARTEQVENDDDEEANTDDEFKNIQSPEDREKLRKKIGTKKLAKLEAKAERRAMNEQIQRDREERKEREKQEEERRKKEEEEEKRIEKENEEKERLLREEQEKREHEEYLKLKQQFVIESEGQDEALNETDEQNLLQKFVDFIKKSKVVLLEELAAEFRLKTQDVINRITQVEEMGLLTGLMDDRGKYIFVSEDEYKKVATFLRQRGRVSIHDLAQASSELINLNSNLQKITVAE